MFYIYSLFFSIVTVCSQMSSMKKSRHFSNKVIEKELKKQKQTKVPVRHILCLLFKTHNMI